FRELDRDLLDIEQRQPRMVQQCLAVGSAGQVLLLADRDEEAKRREVNPARQRGFGRGDRAGLLGVGIVGRHVAFTAQGWARPSVPTIMSGVLRWARRKSAFARPTLLSPRPWRARCRAGAS